MNIVNDTLVIDGVTWYKAKTIAKQLGYVNPAKAVWSHVDKTNKKSMKDRLQTKETMIRNEIYISKDGLHSLIITSNMPNSIARAEQYNINIERK